jgi:hypothetical protein
LFLIYLLETDGGFFFCKKKKISVVKCKLKGCDNKKKVHKAENNDSKKIKRQIRIISEIRLR